MKGEIDSNTTIVGDFNTPLTSLETSSRQKINKATKVLKDTIDQLNLTDIYRTLQPEKGECTFFSSKNRTLSRIDHILSHKTSLNKFIKPEIDNRKKKKRKRTNTWRLNDMLLKKPVDQ